MFNRDYFNSRRIRTFLCILLAMSMIFCMSGCGSKNSDKDGTSVQSEQTGMDEEKKAQLKEAEEKGLLFLVNKEHPVDKNYVPDDLEPIKYFAADRNKYSRFMRAEAAEHFHQLVEAAAEENIDIVMTTAYRSYEFQEILWNNYVAQKGEEEANKTSARPGESEHQTGLAVDLSTSEIDYRNSSDFADTAAGRWVAENAHKFGSVSYTHLL